MKLKKISLAVSATAVLLMFAGNSTVYASENNKDSVQTPQKLPLTKKLEVLRG